MALEWAARLGSGVVLAWAALPLLVKLARRSGSAPPAVYYRALLAALAIATGLIILPLVRSGSSIALTLLRPGRDLAETSTATFVRELVSPLLGSATRAWPAVPWIPLLAAVGCIWLLLLAAGVSSWLTRQLRVHRTCGPAASAPAYVIARAERIATELGVRTPPIRVLGGNAAAFSYGAIEPVIVISTSTCALRDDELDFVLRHELCHIAQHDTRAVCLIDLAQRCFAGHPSLRRLASELRLAREARADKAAAGKRSLEYARFLLTIAQRMDAGHAPFGSWVSMADTALERRIDMLINPDSSRPRRSAPWLVLTALGLCGVVFLAPEAMSQPEAHAGPASGTVSVEAPTLLTPPYEERRAELEAREGMSQSLTREQIRATMRSYFPQLRGCFERVDATLHSASVNMSFVIGRDGRAVDGNTIDKTDPPADPTAFAQLAQCVDDVRRTMQFPVPDGGIVTVDYPVTFGHE